MLLTYLFCDIYIPILDDISRYFLQTISRKLSHFSRNIFSFSSLEGSVAVGCLINMGFNQRVFSGGEREYISKESNGRLKNDKK